MLVFWAHAHQECQGIDCPVTVNSLLQAGGQWGPQNGGVIPGTVPQIPTSGVGRRRKPTAAYGGYAFLHRRRTRGGVVGGVGKRSSSVWRHWVNAMLQVADTTNQTKTTACGPQYKFFGPGDGKCTDQGYEVIKSAEDCKLAGEAIGMLHGFDGQTVGPAKERPAGCYCMRFPGQATVSHCHLNRYVTDDGPGGGGFGYACKQVVEYDFFAPGAGKCTDKGYEIIDTAEDCQLAGEAIGMLHGFDGQTVGPAKVRPAGCYCMKFPGQATVSHCHLNRYVTDDGPGGGGFGYSCKRCGGTALLQSQREEWGPWRGPAKAINIPDISGTWDKLDDTIGDAVDAVKDTTGDAVDAAGDTVGEMLDAAGDAVGDAVPRFGDMVDAASGSVGDVVDATSDAVGDAVPRFGDTIGDVFDVPKPKPPTFDVSKPKLPTKPDHPFDVFKR